MAGATAERETSVFIANDMTELIGRTPLLDMKRLFLDADARILAKLEMSNPTSIKDRAALSMITEAMKAGKITSDTEVVEATSGNTGIGIACLSAILGFKARIYMSELCSIERQKLVCAYGATVVLTPAEEHTVGARNRGIAYCEENPDTTFFLNQHSNPDNAHAHYTTTGPEMWEQTGGDIDAIVIGLGTCGTFEGLSKFFKEKNPGIQMIGVEPAGSPVYSGGERGPHKIGGIGPGMITDNFERVRAHVDDILLCSDDDAYEWARLITSKEGLIAGPTSGATAWGAGELATRDEYKGKTIICFIYDTGERYLSVNGLFSADKIFHQD